MKRNILSGMFISVLSAAALLTTGFAVAESNDGFEWPRLFVIATPGTNSGSFASTNAWVPYLQKDTGMTVRVIPEGNEVSRYNRLTTRSTIQLVSVAAAEMRAQTQGTDNYADTKPAPQRLVWHHNDSPWGFVVSGDSKLQSLSDLKNGKYRVAKGMFSSPMQISVTQALPAFVGLSEQETKEHLQFIPVSSYAENCRSVVEGKADVAYCSAISSVMSEAEAAPGGIRWLPMEVDNKEAWARYLQYRPMHVPTEISLGVSSAKGVDGATSNFVYATTVDADTELVYHLAKWMHQHYADYKDSHLLASRMSLEQFRSYLDRSPLPVHEGTVRYLREIGAWTDKDDAWNEQAKKKMDQWVAARQAAMEEARKAGVKVKFDNPEYLAILDKHTEGLEGFQSRL